MGMVYLPSDIGGELRQAEILSDLVRYDINSETQGASRILLGFAVVVSQDCDLLQDYTVRQSSEKGNLDHVIVYEAQSADTVKANHANDLWRRISQNQNERFQLLGSVPPDDDAAGVGIYSLIIDFRSIFSMPTEEVYRQIAAKGGATRRCRLADLYREQLQSRAAYFFARVMTPEPHKFVSAKALPAPGTKKGQP